MTHILVVTCIHYMISAVDIPVMRENSFEVFSV